MKRFEEMNNEELNSLTEEGIESLIDLECAYRSIPLLPELPEQPVLKEIEKDRTIYVIPEVKFLNKEEAKTVLELIQKCSLTSTSGWGDNERLYPMNEYSEAKITEKKLYSQEQFEKVEGQINDNKRAKDKYESAKSEYDKVKKQRKELENEIYEKLEEIRAAKAKKEEMKRLFARYLELAGGDKEIAYNFLVNAYPEAAENEEILSLKGGAE